MTDAFLLGAGFSIAVNDRFPSTNELGIRAVRLAQSWHRARYATHSGICDGLSCDRPVLDDGRIPAPNRDFETWLSRLSMTQPFLLAADNGANQILFETMSSAIEFELRAATETTLDGPTPPWLIELVRGWHDRKAHVVTFNYDTLVEATVDYLGKHGVTETGGECRPLAQYLVGPANLLMPIWRVLGGDQEIDSLSLYKLHGSLSWYWDPMTRSAESMVNQVRMIRGWDEPAEEAVAEVRRGKVPVIVPPTMSKNLFLENSTIRTLWRKAFEALRRADRLFVIGYSLPAGDQLVGSLLAEAFRTKPIDVWIVDLDAGVGDRFKEAGAHNVDVSWCGPGAVPNFVAWYPTS